MKIKNIKELNNKETLLNILNDNEKFNEKVTETEGYILSLMERHEIKPNLELLLENENIYSLNFILKNYDLTKEQIKKIKKYFNVRASNKVTSQKLTEDEIIEHLENNEILNRNTILSTKVLNKYYKEIDEQYELDRWNLEIILKNSIKNFSKEEMIGLNKEFLKRNSSLMNEHPSYFKDKNYADLYIEMLKENIKIESRALILNDFPHYEFTEKDIDLIDQLLKNHRSALFDKGYLDLNAYKGIQDLVSKMDYFTKYNASSLESFNLSEVEENKKVIQDILWEKLKEDSPKHYLQVKNILDKKITLEQFKIILDEDYIEKILSYYEQISLDFYNSDDKLYIEKLEHFVKLIVNFMLLKKEDTDVVNLSETIGLLKQLNRFKNEDEKREVRKVIFEKLMPLALKSKSFNYLECDLLKREEPEELKIFIEKNPSVNLLITLLAEYDKTKTNDKFDRDFKKRYKSLIDNLISNLNKDEIKPILKEFNYKGELFSFSGKKEKSNPDDNVLIYEFEDLTKINPTVLLMLIRLKDGFKERVFKEKVLLDGYRFRNIYNKKEYKDFVNEYINLNKEELLKTDWFIEFINENENLKSTHNIEIKEDPEAIYNEMLNNLHTMQKINEEISLLRGRGERDYDGSYFFSQENEDACEEKYREREELNQEQSKLSSKISDSFKKEKIKSLFNDKNYDLIKTMKEESFFSSNEFSIIYQLTNELTFNDLLSNLDNVKFRELILKGVSEDASYINFDHFNEKEKVILANLIMPYLEKPKFVTSFFSQDGMKGFIHELAIENFPKEIFYSYKYAKETSYGSKPNIKRKFTIEELLKAFKSLNKKEGFFSKMDVNASYEKFFKDTIGENIKDFKKILEIAKDIPKLYAILANDAIFIDLLNSEDGETLDEKKMNFFKDNFDLDIVLKGLTEVIEDCKNNQSNTGFNNKVALNVIQRVIWLTYSETTGYNIIHKSSFTQEETDKIINFFLKETPQYLFSIRNIGCIENVQEYLKNNINKFLNKDDEFLEDILINKKGLIRSDYGTINSSKSIEDDANNKKAYLIMDTLVDFYLNNKKEEDINYLSYLMQQETFFENEISSDYKYKSRQGDKELLSLLENIPDFKKKISIVGNKFFLENALTKSEDKIIRKVKKI